MSHTPKGRIEEIRERAEKATPGPWATVGHDLGDESYCWVSDEIIEIQAGRKIISSEGGLAPASQSWGKDQIDADAEFISHVRADIPYLLEINADLLAALEAPTWLIWSHEAGWWWKPDGNGYTPDIDKAGRYSFTQAMTICKLRSAREDGLPNETAVPSPEWISTRDVAIARAKGQS